MSWWQYLLLVNIYLVLFYGFYALLLSRESFFQLNRVYLVSAAVLSFLIPVIQSDWVKNIFITEKVAYTLYTSPVLLYRFKPAADDAFTIGQLLTFIYIAGITLLLLRLAWKFIMLRRIIRDQHSPVAYSFFKKIKLGHDDVNAGVIAAHEDVHAKEWHSLDVLIMEGLVILNWFNPIVYCYRFAIKHIHEFIADKKAVQTGIDKAAYAHILLSQTFSIPTHDLVTPFFNKSLLKRRIIMLQKNRSRRVALVKYFLSAPLFILMMVLSSAMVSSNKALILIDRKVGRELALPFSPAGYIKFKARAARLRTDTPKVRKTLTLTVTVSDTSKNKVFTAVEQVPQFPGGLPAFYKFLSTNITYPVQAKEKHVQGRVIISFIVEQDGSLSNFKVARSVESDMDEEAIRVLSISPKWQPGTQNGHAVRVAYTVPINFILGPDAQPGSDGKKSGAIRPNPSDGTINKTAAVPNAADTSEATRLAALNFTISQHPLYIVDGTKQYDMSNIDPKDIKSIRVLKGGTATALYGNDGAHGVVLVETRIDRLKKYIDAPILKPVDTRGFDGGGRYK
jgi:TonB family protein